jgi:3-methylcrotonyl-CoA carboxylase alpha subunit
MRAVEWISGNGRITVQIEESAGGAGVLRLNNRTIPFVILDRDATGGCIEIDGKNQQYYLHQSGDQVEVWVAGRVFRLDRVQPGKSSLESAQTVSGEIRALMPGKIRRVDAAPGMRVTEKQPLIVMESMKMESTLAAPRAGTLKAVKCQEGQLVAMGELLAVIE